MSYHESIKAKDIKMKTVRTFVFPLLISALMTGLVMNFTACTEQSPLSPTDTLSGFDGVLVIDFSEDAEQSADKGGLALLGSTVSATAIITPEEGRHAALEVRL